MADALPAPLIMAEEAARARELVPGFSSAAMDALSAATTDPASEHSLVVVLVTTLVAGVVLEQLGLIKLRRLMASFDSRGEANAAALCVYAVIRMLFGLVGLALFYGTGLAVVHFMVTSGAPREAMLDAVLLAIFNVRAIAIVSDAIFSPRDAEVRVLPLDDPSATLFHRWLVIFSIYYSLVSLVVHVLFVGGIDPVLGRLTLIAGGGSVAVLFTAFITIKRDQVAAQFRDSDEPPGRIGRFLGRLWPMLLAIWMLALFLNWSRAVFLNNVERIDAMMVAWWVTLLFPIGDRLFHAVLGGLLERDFVTNSSFASRVQRFRRVMQTGFRVLLGAVAVFAVAVAWDVAGVSLLQSDVGREVLRVVINIGITLLLAYIVFEVVVAMLDARMPSPSAEAAEISDGEGGGAGATRAETLAPLVRGTFIVLLVAIVILTILSSLGIEVAPLLAGAGVFGIAIGFGAQKLVQDIISGLFFLLDDAFRRGEYIDVGSVKGTVEKISIRSMQLRHHMGNLHTIPFGEIRFLTNFSRDWVMMKLKLRLAYGTDPEQVRKVVKKLGQELMDHPELGEKFMEPLKSQGVFSMEDDSAMIFRVKFMTRPGDQFVVRKAVFAAIHDRFDREGIRFAHRVVTVKVEDEVGLSPESKEQVAAAVLPPAGASPAGAGGDAR